MQYMNYFLVNLFQRLKIGKNVTLSGAQAWNALPVEIKQPSSLQIFKAKTNLPFTFNYLTFYLFTAYVVN